MLRKNKGFTLIELLAVIVILAIIMVIATPIVIKTIDDAKRGAFKNSVYGIIKASEFNYARKLLENEKGEMQYKYEDGKESSPSGDIELDYKGLKPQNGTIIIDKEGKITLAFHNGKYCATKSYNSDDVILEEKDLDDCKLPLLVVVNPPQLFEKMTPVKWDANLNEISTTEDDSDWYDYGNKKWANAKTEDGSYWVWIPRYAYKITEGYGIKTNDGEIDVKFLSGTTNNTLDNTHIRTSGYIEDDSVNDTSNNYFLHPAFKFGDDIPGFWVAKFSPSKNNKDGVDEVKIEPNATIWTSISVSQAFSKCREMEEKTTLYGWLPNEVDTHMMKNIEWGAVAYLSKSQYGAEGKVEQNKNSSYKTGYKGTDILYNTSDGVKASTTHTIYGVYDMNGGAWEYVMGNLGRQKGSSGFSDDLLEVEAKYIDVYTEDYKSDKYGDAIYETSSSSSGTTSWDGAYSNFVTGSSPWFGRGGDYNSLISGVFSFHSDNGYGNNCSHSSFRPVVVRSVGN